MFRRGTFTQDVVHNHLWIAVDMWKILVLIDQLVSVGVICVA